MEGKILFLSKGANASSTRYRAYDFFPLFKEAGWQPTHLKIQNSLSGRIQLLQAAQKVDTVVIVRSTFSFLFARLLRYFSRQLVFTFDDAIFTKSSGERSKGRERRFAATLPFCDQIWAGNNYLADQACQFNPHVTIIPTALDMERYSIQANKSNTHLDLVWIGSQSTKKHLVTVIPALEAATALIPTLRLKIIADFTLESNQLEIIPIQWSPESEVQELASAHIGIAPLPDNTFTRGKCGLKILQYMAAGLPVISSPTGVNKDIVANGSSGLLAANKQEWVESIQRLAQDINLRSSMGAAGQKRCREHFTLTATFKKMLSTLGAQSCNT